MIKISKWQSPSIFCFTNFSDNEAFGGVTNFSRESDGFCEYYNGQFVFSCQYFEWYGSCFMQYSLFVDVVAIGGQIEYTLRSAGKYKLYFYMFHW